MAEITCAGQKISSFLAGQLCGVSTNRFSLGHVPVQPSTQDMDVALFIEPVVYIEVSFLITTFSISNSKLCSGETNCMHFTTAIF